MIGELVEARGRIPLAIRMAAANLHGGPPGAVEEYVGRLATADRSALLRVDGDEPHSVRAAFDVS